MDYTGMTQWLLDCEPRPVQLEAISRSFFGVATRDGKDLPTYRSELPHFGSPAKGWCHFLEMRLGKTPLAFNEFMLFMSSYGFRRLLVLSPMLFKYGWQSEAKAFNVPVDCHVLESHQREAAWRFLKKHRTGTSMLVAHYEATGSDENMRLLLEYVDKATLIVADESVLIKNPNSIYTQAVMLLQKQAGATRPMTGLPNPQGPHDFYSQLRFAYQLNGVQFQTFKTRHCKTGGFKGKKVVGVRKEAELMATLKPCSFIARRIDWSDHHAPDFQQEALTMTPKQTERYKTMENEFVAFLDSGEAVEAEQIVSKYAKLQQISSGFIMDENRKSHWFEPFHKTPKFLDLETRLQFIPKVLVMAHHREVVSSLYNELKKKGYNPGLIASAGQMKDFNLDVEAEKKKFNNDSTSRVLVAQLKAVKYGHTLRGTKELPCLTTIFYENSYSLDDRIQAEQRNQGVDSWGQVNIVDYYSSEAERRVVEALQFKKDLSEVILGYYRRGT